MANRVVYISVRLDITNDNVNEITDEMVEDIITETDYHFGNVGDCELETEICGLID
jgi:hypothetical protein